MSDQMKLGTPLLIGAVAVSLGLSGCAARDAGPARLDQGGLGEEYPRIAGGLELEISFGRARVSATDPVPITLTYMNRGDKALLLWANGLAANGGFAGETFVVAGPDGTHTYEFFGVDPMIEAHGIEPAGKWTREIPDLRAALTGGGVLVDREIPDGTTRLWTPFQKRGEYWVRVVYIAVARDSNIENVYKGAVRSNTATVIVQ